jgi:predicted esterase
VAPPVRAAVCRTLAASLAGAMVCAHAAQEPPRGRIIDDVRCAKDPSQGYALYLPSAYSPARSWSLLVAFHPGARGRAMVEKYAAAAEQYGYIVAGSNNSRNGSWEASAAAVQAMTADLGERFAIDVRRLYMTGLSGGARVAMQVALATNKITGVIASSAGYPDSRPRKSVPFVLFGTAGTEDFNYIEMRQLDRALTSPHRVVIFEGGHTLPPDAVALEAIEWLEVQAMKSGAAPRNEPLIDRLLAAREEKIAAAGESAAGVHLLRALVDDFGGLRDVSAASARLAQRSKDKTIKRALDRERADDDAEARLLDEVLAQETALADSDRHLEALAVLRSRLAQLSKSANAADDSPERRQARRVLRTITVGAGERVRDPDYLKLLDQYRLPGSGRGAAR